MPTPSAAPSHGEDGWVLEDMDWDPITGVAIFEYSNVDGVRHITTSRSQPTSPAHEDFLSHVLSRYQPSVFTLDYRRWRTLRPREK